MNDLEQLYQDVILDHYKKPRNFRRALPEAHCHAEGVNPLCGDKVTVFVQVEDDRVKDVSFEGSGCAISTASASLMTEALVGKSLAEAEALFQRFHALVTKGGSDADLGKLAALGGVSKYPTRVKCATLAWHTLRAALEGKHDTVSTE